MHFSGLVTPALVADLTVFEANVATMAARRPGLALRPHVKAFKSTTLAQRLAKAGHTAFCCATVAEVEGMAAAGLGGDLLLANQVLDAKRLGALVAAGSARVTVAVDSPETIAAAAAGGVREVLIDVDVGMPRGGCAVTDAGRLGDAARAAGLEVRGVMGYEGHLMHVADTERRVSGVERSMAVLTEAHQAVGGEVVSGGGTGSWDCNQVVTELQAGSYVLMDTDYGRLDLPFTQGLFVLASVISLGSGGHAVLDAGLKALAMDSGPPTLVGEGEVLYCADEHTVVVNGSWQVGDRVLLRPAHIDPTMAKHEKMYIATEVPVAETALVADAEVVDEWPIDLRGW
ncbi:MAG: metal-activated pyridoxal enzyme [Actinobacteria bacterium]|jgi:D-serine deaminase-like pyridoxal phosphate-dependent protein|nr:metal-activated pyridoxal enzyme [Actinomycetota bacterium]MBT3968730.1 metal-activated pyridoxal enzyme [Actinomycetota bacterium]